MAIKPNFKHRFWKNDGSVNAGGKVYTYVAGTSTPVTTYTDSTAGTPNTNPIILDSKGEAEIWTNVLIKVNVLESDNTQVTGWPVDNVGNAVTNNDATMRYSGTAGGTANALTISPSPSITSYALGQSFIFKAGASNNSGATTIAISGLTSITVQLNGAACVGGEILANMWYKIILSATDTCQIDKHGRSTLAELGLSTSDSPQFAGINVGHASDTTITRASAGTIAVEGVNVLTTATGAALTGATFTGGINEARGSVAMHATTMDLWAQPNVIDGTGGAVTVTAIGNAPQAGARRVLYPVADSVITNGATFAVDGAVNHTAVAGDKWEFEAITTSTYKVHVTKKDGSATKELAKINDFRLTLTTGLPVTTADVMGATNVYMAPYEGNRIALYTSGVWRVYEVAEVTLTLGTLISGRPYDVFVFDNSGVVALASVAWTNGTTRATALTRQDGVLCKTGATAYRYLGTFYTTSTTTTEDSYSKRFLWNYYHRKERPLKRNESTASWTYTTATWRQANGAAANQVEAVIGVAEDAVEMETSCAMSNASSGIQVGTGVGVDSTTVNSASLSGTSTANGSTASNATSKYRGFPAAGYHYFAWLEYSTATGTTTWTAFNGTLLAGIIGILKG